MPCIGPLHRPRGGPKPDFDFAYLSHPPNNVPDILKLKSPLRCTKLAKVESISILSPGVWKVDGRWREMESDTVSTAEIITQITSQGNAEKTFENDTFLFCRRGMKSQSSNDKFFGGGFQPTKHSSSCKSHIYHASALIWSKTWEFLLMGG